MHIVNTCEFCGEVLDGDVFMDVETTEWMQALGAQVVVSYTLCNAPLCGLVNEIVDYSEVLASV